MDPMGFNYPFLWLVFVWELVHINDPCKIFFFFNDPPEKERAFKPAKTMGFFPSWLEEDFFYVQKGCEFFEFSC